MEISLLTMDEVGQQQAVRILTENLLNSESNHQIIDAMTRFIHDRFAKEIE